MGKYHCQNKMKSEHKLEDVFQNIGLKIEKENMKKIRYKS